MKNIKAKIKSKLLTKLFMDWVKTEKDVELLTATRIMIENRKNQVTGHSPVVGFKRYTAII